MRALVVAGLVFPSDYLNSVVLPWKRESIELSTNFHTIRGGWAGCLIYRKAQELLKARCFSVPAITRNELMSLTEECAKVTGIPYLMDAYRKEALKILIS